MLSVLVCLAVLSKAAFDILVGLAVPVEAAIGLPLDIYACYDSLGGACSAAWRGNWRPDRVWHANEVALGVPVGSYACHAIQGSDQPDFWRYA